MRPNHLFTVLVPILISLSSMGAHATALKRSEIVVPTQSGLGIENQTVYARITGKLNPGQTGDALLDELEATFLSPLRGNRVATFTYIMQAMGDQFYLNLVAEPKSEASIPVFEKYLQDKEGSIFHGLSVHYSKVATLNEGADFLAGVFDNAQEDDPFVQNFSMERHFTFRTIADWAKFTDDYGFALLSKDHSKFLSYIENFIGNAADFATVLDVMKKDTMVAIDPRVSLTLDDQTEISSDIEHSAFLPFRFFRYCFRQGFEQGTCAPTHP